MVWPQIGFTKLRDSLHAWPELFVPASQLGIPLEFAADVEQQRALAFLQNCGGNTFHRRAGTRYAPISDKRPALQLVGDYGFVLHRQIWWDSDAEK